MKIRKATRRDVENDLTIAKFLKWNRETNSAKPLPLR